MKTKYEWEYRPRQWIKNNDVGNLAGFDESVSLTIICGISKICFTSSYFHLVPLEETRHGKQTGLKINDPILSLPYLILSLIIN